MIHKMDHKLNLKMRFTHPNTLNKDAVLLLLVSALFTVAVALSNTFVNVFLWKLKKDYVVIGWFNFYQYLAMMIIFILAGKMAKSIDRIVLLRLGVGSSALFYLIVLLLGTSSVEKYIILGLVLGIGQGFYWFSFNLLYFEITEPENRDVFNGWNGLMTSSGGIIAPFLSGWIITHQSGFTGYKIIFFISFVIFFAAVLVSFLFYQRTYHGKYVLTKVLLQAKTNSEWRNITLGMVAQGGREGVIIFLIGILIYVSTKSEFSLGTYTMAVSGVSLITYYLVGKVLRKKWRKQAMMIGALMMAVVVIPMFFQVQYRTLLIYGIGTSLFAPLYFIPLTSMIFDKIGENEESAKLRGEFIVLREIGLNVGRMLIILFFLFFIKKVGVEHLRYLLLLAGSLQIVTWVFMKRIKMVYTD